VRSEHARWEALVRSEANAQRRELWCTDQLGLRGRLYLARALMREPRLGRAVEEALLTKMTPAARVIFVRAFCEELRDAGSAADAIGRTVVRTMNDLAGDLVAVDALAELDRVAQAGREEGGLR
jgi:hypothetical protein